VIVTAVVVLIVFTQKGKGSADDVVGETANPLRDFRRCQCLPTDHTGLAAQGGWWQNGKSNFDRNPFSLYELAILSGENIVSDLHASGDAKQLVLL
jgi:hypothetical protein